MECRNIKFNTLSVPLFCAIYMSITRDHRESFQRSKWPLNCGKGVVRITRPLTRPLTRRLFVICISILKQVFLKFNINFFLFYNKDAYKNDRLVSIRVRLPTYGQFDRKMLHQNDRYHKSKLAAI